MLEIKRDLYLKRLIDSQENGLVKIITGMRRSGKSYLLDPIFKNQLLSTGIKPSHIIKLDLEIRENSNLLDPDNLNQYLLSKIKDQETYYLLLDEIQMVPEFESVLNGLLKKGNLDIYVTGSNSRFLSSDIVTEFRGRGDEIRVFPLSFSEYSSAYNGSEPEAWEDYLTFGGLPYILTQKTAEQKTKYLNNLFETTYLVDICERNNVQRREVLDSLINILASSVGSLTNPLKLSNSFTSKSIKDVSNNTIASYLDYLLDAFLIEKADRYDIKGKNYISTPSKYYFSDIGLRNARLNFRQQEENHLMENIIYNELLIRGYNVDIGVVEIREGNSRKQLEVDFVCNQGNKRYYVQSALNLDTSEKTAQETRSLKHIDDSFKKIVVVKDSIKPWRNDDGILIMDIKDFLLNSNSLDL